MFLARFWQTFTFAGWPFSGRSPFSPFSARSPCSARFSGRLRFLCFRALPRFLRFQALLVFSRFRKAFTFSESSRFRAALPDFSRARAALPDFFPFSGASPWSGGLVRFFLTCCIVFILRLLQRNATPQHPATAT